MYTLCIVKMEELYPGPSFHLNKSSSPPGSHLTPRHQTSSFNFSSTAPISTDIKNISERTFVKTFKKSFFGRLLTVSLLLRNKEIYLYFYKVLYIFRVNDFQYLISTQYLQNQYIWAELSSIWLSL